MKRTVNELKRWDKVRDYIGEEEVILGPYFSYQIRHTPRRVLFTLSHYKFAAKLIGDGKRVLEVGSNEGLGTVLLAEFAKKVVAIDIDKKAIGEAKRNFASDKIEFRNSDFLGMSIGKFDAFVSFDVIEHIYPRNEKRFLDSICRNLKRECLCIIGTPNKTSDIYASKVTKLGHVNLYAWDRLKSVMEKRFRHVFIFSCNDEVVHTGFYPMAHYLIGVGVNKK